MLKTPREKIILKQGLIAIAIMVGLYIFVLSPFLKEGNSILNDELERKTREIEKYITRTGSLPSKKSFERLQKEKSAMEGKLKSFIDFIDPQETRISSSTTEAGLYFIERLHSLMKRFSEESSPKGIALPENLGFGDGLPKEGMVDTLLRQLETVEVIMDILLKSDKIEFSAIKPLKPIDYVESLSKELFYTELPVQISIKTDTATLIDLLLKIKNKSPVISVREMHIKSSDPATGNIEVSLVVSTFKLARGTR